MKPRKAHDVCMKEEQYYEGEREDIIALIPSQVRRLLDVGCGFGYMAKRLKERQQLEVVGIESEPKAEAEAKGNVDTLIIGDVEGVALPFEQGYFDCIVYGDVLEHLRDPWQLVKSHAHYLKKGGWCIASIPNVAHYAVIKGLLRGKWEYAPAGILDNTHLRFFTLKGIQRMFEDAGYVIEQKQDLRRASKAARMLNSLAGEKIGHLLAEQYIVKMRLV